MKPLLSGCGHLLAVLMRVLRLFLPVLSDHKKFNARISVSSFNSDTFYKQHLFILENLPYVYIYIYINITFLDVSVVFLMTILAR